LVCVHDQANVLLRRTHWVAVRHGCHVMIKSSEGGQRAKWRALRVSLFRQVQGDPSCNRDEDGLARKALGCMQQVRSC
jgi:hypothetical protein